MKKKFALVLSIIFVLILIFTRFGQTTFKTFLLTSEFVPNFPFKPLHFFTKEPKVSSVIIEAKGEKINADLYVPVQKGKHPAIIVSLGSLADRKTAQLVHFADSLARVGFVVLVPDLPDLLDGHVISTSTDQTIDVFNWLYNREEVDQKRIGFGGFCVGSTIDILASEKASINSKVSFIATVSPYFNSRQLVGEIVTKSYEDNGKIVAWEPNPLSIKTLNKGLAKSVDSSEQTKLLSVLEQTSSALPVNLSADSQAVWKLFQINNLQLAQDYYDKDLPKQTREILEEVSPDKNLKDLKAHLFILSSTTDSFIPPVHSEELAKNLPSSQVTFNQIDTFDHVIPGNNLKLIRAIHQGGKLYLFIWNFLHSSLFSPD